MLFNNFNNFKDYNNLQYLLSEHYIHLFLTTSFPTISLSLLKLTGTGTNLSTSNYLLV